MFNFTVEQVSLITGWDIHSLTCHNVINKSDPSIISIFHLLKFTFNTDNLLHTSCRETFTLNDWEDTK